jgi:hypothetical protein
MFRLVCLAGLGLLVPSGLTAQASLQHVQLSVEATKGTWTPTGLTVAPGDLLFVQAEGTVSIGPHHAPVGPDGAPRILNAGALEIKIAIYSGHLIGAVGCLVADQSGPVLVRIHDSRYEDNTGVFRVRILQVPTGAVPPPTVVRQ